MMAEMIKRFCEFESKFQDEQYGKNMRLHTVSKKGDKITCTVCGTKKDK
jgi:hypothetical protein